MRALEELEELEELEVASRCREQGPKELGHWRQTKLWIGQAGSAIEVYGIESVRTIADVAFRPRRLDLIGLWQDVGRLGRSVQG